MIQKKYIRHPSNPSIRYVQIISDNKIIYGWCNEKGITSFEFDNTNVSLSEAMILFQIKKLK